MSIRFIDDNDETTGGDGFTEMNRRCKKCGDFEDRHVGPAKGCFPGLFSPVEIDPPGSEPQKQDYFEKWQAAERKLAELEKQIEVARENKHGASGLCCSLREQEKTAKEAAVQERDELKILLTKTKVELSRLELAESLKGAAHKVVEAWNRNGGRVFESMGSDNPRALCIDESIEQLSAELQSFIQKATKA